MQERVINTSPLTAFKAFGVAECRRHIAKILQIKTEQGSSMMLVRLFHVHVPRFVARWSCKFAGNRPVIEKRAVIGSKGGWKLSTIFKL